MALRQNAIREKIMEREPGFVPDPAVTMTQEQIGSSTVDIVTSSVPDADSTSNPSSLEGIPGVTVTPKP